MWCRSSDFQSERIKSAKQHWKVGPVVHQSADEDPLPIMKYGELLEMRLYAAPFSLFPSLSPLLSLVSSKNNNEIIIMEKQQQLSHDYKPISIWIPHTLTLRHAHTHTHTELNRKWNRRPIRHAWLQATLQRVWAWERDGDKRDCVREQGEYSLLSLCEPRSHGNMKSFVVFLFFVDTPGNVSDERILKVRKRRSPSSQ